MRGSQLLKYRLSSLSQHDIHLSPIGGIRFAHQQIVRYQAIHHPDGAVPELAIACDCRKPQPGLLLRAAAEQQIDLAHSWFVGDILDDVEAGHRAGCRTVLVDLGTESLPTSPLRRPDLVAGDTPHALALIAAAEGLGPPVEMNYRPMGWELEESKR